MEPFLRKWLTFLSLWDKIWPVGVLDDCVLRTPDAEPEETEPPGAEPSGPLVSPELFMALCDFTAWCVTELSISRGDRLFTLKEEDDYILARRLLGQPSAGLVSRTHVTRATPDVLSDQPWSLESQEGPLELGGKPRPWEQLLDAAGRAPGGQTLRGGWWTLSGVCAGLSTPSEGLTGRQNWGWGWFSAPSHCSSIRGGSSAVPARAADMKLADLTKEIQTLKSLRQERLILLHAVCSAGEPLYIVSELMRKGNLQAYLGGEWSRRPALPRPRFRSHCPPPPSTPSPLMALPSKPASTPAPPQPQPRPPGPQPHPNLGPTTPGPPHTGSPTLAPPQDPRPRLSASPCPPPSLPTSTRPWPCPSAPPRGRRSQPPGPAPSSSLTPTRPRPRVELRSSSLTPPYFPPRLDPGPAPRPQPCPDFSLAHLVLLPAPLHLAPHHPGPSPPCPTRDDRAAAAQPPPPATHVDNGPDLFQVGVLQDYLAARSVQVGDDLSCKVADFGLARLLKDNIYSPSSGTKIPIRWTTPEAASYRVYTQKSDVCSFGVLLFKVFTYGQCPYEGMTNHETLQQISRGYRLPRLATCPAEVYVLVLECWKASPEEQPAFAELQEKLGAGYRCLHLAVT
ncbi:LOW QUALITY PROTEIN: tyrosine-protein kinase Srms-like [Dugong dugon]